jgi:hypothetical protein
MDDDHDREASRLAGEVYEFCAWLVESEGADADALISAMTAALIHITQERNEAEEQTKQLLGRIMFGGGGKLH